MKKCAPSSGRPPPRSPVSISPISHRSLSSPSRARRGPRLLSPSHMVQKLAQESTGAEQEGTQQQQQQQQEELRRILAERDHEIEALREKLEQKDAEKDVLLSALQQLKKHDRKKRKVNEEKAITQTPKEETRSLGGQARYPREDRFRATSDGTTITQKDQKHNQKPRDKFFPPPKKGGGGGGCVDEDSHSSSLSSLSSFQPATEEEVCKGPTGIPGEEEEEDPQTIFPRHPLNATALPTPSLTFLAPKVAPSVHAAGSLSHEKYHHDPHVPPSVHHHYHHHSQQHPHQATVDLATYLLLHFQTHKTSDTLDSGVEADLEAVVGPLFASGAQVSDSVTVVLSACGVVITVDTPSRPGARPRYLSGATQAADGGVGVMTLTTTCLHIMVAKGQVAALQIALEDCKQRVDFTVLDSYGCTPLHLLAATSWIPVEVAVIMAKVICHRLFHFFWPISVNWFQRCRSAIDVLTCAAVLFNCGAEVSDQGGRGATAAVSRLHRPSLVESSPLLRTPPFQHCSPTRSRHPLDFVNLAAANARLAALYHVVRQLSVFDDQMPNDMILEVDPYPEDMAGLHPLHERPYFVTAEEKPHADFLVICQQHQWRPKPRLVRRLLRSVARMNGSQNLLQRRLWRSEEGGDPMQGCRREGGEGTTPLHEFLYRSGTVELVRVCLTATDFPLDFTMRDGAGATPLHALSLSKSREEVAALLHLVLDRFYPPPKGQEHDTHHVHRLHHQNQNHHYHNNNDNNGSCSSDRSSSSTSTSSNSEEKMGERGGEKESALHAPDVNTLITASLPQSQQDAKHGKEKSELPPVKCSTPEQQWQELELLEQQWKSAARGRAKPQTVTPSPPTQVQGRHNNLHIHNSNNLRNNRKSPSPAPLSPVSSAASRRRPAWKVEETGTPSPGPRDRWDWDILNHAGHNCLSFAAECGQLSTWWAVLKERRVEPYFSPSASPVPPVSSASSPARRHPIPGGRPGTPRSRAGTSGYWRSPSRPRGPTPITSTPVSPPRRLSPSGARPTLSSPSSSARNRNTNISGVARRSPSRTVSPAMIPITAKVVWEDWLRLSADDQKRFQLMNGFQD